MTVDLVHDAIWLNCHLGTAITCACLPTLRPLVAKAASVINSMSHGSSKSSASRSKQGVAGHRSNDRYQPLQSGDKFRLSLVTPPPAGTDVFRSEEERVRRTVDIV